MEAARSDQPRKAADDGGLAARAGASGQPV
jgi:hypothetical protein